MRLAQRRRQRRDGAARGPAGGPRARRAGWSRTARIAGIVAVGALVVIWLNVVPGTRQLAADRPPVPRLPAVDEEALPAGLGEGAARLRERLGAAPRPVESARNPFRLPVAGERAVPLPTAWEGPRSAPRAGARSSVNLGLTLIGIATTETADGPRRTAVLLRRGEVVLAEPGQPLGGGWTLADVEDDSASFRNAAGDRQRRTLP
ncbi:MAG: hypothetical protein OXF93_07780 [Acidobacteria bacterium]|nr:hypothetical protein [Acidobacteriota bacterium]